MRTRVILGAIGLCLNLAYACGAQAAPANWPTSLTLASASPGGVYIIYGDALAKILTAKLGIEVDPESVYEYRTINALSFYLAACLGGPAADDGQP